MKKLVIATAVAALAGTPALANHTTTLEGFFADQSFSNKGQCQSALMAERNNRRVNDGNTGSYSDPEYNRVVHAKYACFEGDDGWYVDIVDGWDD